MAVSMLPTVALSPFGGILAGCMAGLAVMTTRAPLVSYFVIPASVLCCMCCASLYNIFAQSFIQRQTPALLLGKVASLITVISICSFPLGQALYGLLFDRVSGFASLILFFSCGASLLVTVAAGKIQRAIPA